MISLISFNFFHFQLFWNVPSAACEELGFDMDPRNLGIRANDHQKNYGKEVVTFYEQFLGIYPYISQKKNATTGEMENVLHRGGLPQVCYTIIGYINISCFRT